MRLSMFTPAVLAAAVSLAACTQLTTTSLPDRPVDESFAARNWTWQQGEQITFAYRIFEQHNRVGLCGARAESPGGGVHQRTFNDRAIATLYLTLGGKILINDISFFNKASYVPDAAPQGSASCVLTAWPWSATYEGVVPKMEAAKTRFRVYD